MPMRTLLAVLALLLSVTAQGSGSKTNAEALSEMLSGYKSYQADFTQTVTTDEGNGSRSPPARSRRGAVVISTGTPTRPWSRPLLPPVTRSRSTIRTFCR